MVEQLAGKSKEDAIRKGSRATFICIISRYEYVIQEDQEEGG
jgi:hypothetical protein